MSESEEKGEPSLWQWFPVAVEKAGEGFLIKWQFVGENSFKKPFFEDSLRLIPLEDRLFRWTSLEAAFNEMEALDYLKPTAFIFHASRCGSTLITQLLVTSSQCMVISEAPIIESALALCRCEATRAYGIEVLKLAVRALGQRRRGIERYFFIKLDSWHIGELAFIREAFPEIPLFYLYRDPLEILGSHQKQRGQQMVPGLLDSEGLGLDRLEMEPADLDGYCLQVLRRFFAKASDGAITQDLLLIHYEELPSLVWTQWSSFLSMVLDGREILLMKERSLRHSKNEIQSFDEDEDHKRRRSGREREKELEDCYEKLEQIRKAQRPWRIDVSIDCA